MNREPFHVSTALRSRLPQKLRFVPLSVLSAIAGLSREQAARLKEDERLIPNVPLLARLGLCFGILPQRVLALDPDVPLAARVPEWFEGGRRARITLVGMGNLGHVQAGLLASRTELEVTCLVSSAERAEFLASAMDAAGGIEVSLGDGRVVKARPDRITHDPGSAVANADFVFLTTPCHLHLEQMRRLLPLMRDGACLSAGPAWGGFNWKARRALDETGKRVHVFGLGGIPTMSKMDVPGQRARVIGVPKSLNVQQPLDAADTALASDVLSMLFGNVVVDIHNYLNINLAPGNQLLHAGIMYDLLRDRGGVPFPEPPLFYEGLSRSGAKLLNAMSRELLGTAVALSRQQPDYWTFRYATLHMGIRLGYAGQVERPWTLYSAIRTNRAYQSIRTPMIRRDDGYVPDFSHRFFAEDVPHGLAIVKGVADIAGTATPRIDEVFRWCQQAMGREYLVGDRLTGADVAESAAPQAFGIHDAASLVASCLPAEPPRAAVA